MRPQLSREIKMLVLQGYGLVVQNGFSRVHLMACIYIWRLDCAVLRTWGGFGFEWLSPSFDKKKFISLHTGVMRSYSRFRQPGNNSYSGLEKYSKALLLWRMILYTTTSNRKFEPHLKNCDVESSDLRLHLPQSIRCKNHNIYLLLFPALVK